MERWVFVGETWDANRSRACRSAVREPFSVVGIFLCDRSGSEAASIVSPKGYIVTYIGMSGYRAFTCIISRLLRRSRSDSLSIRTAGRQSLCGSIHEAHGSRRTSARTRSLNDYHDWVFSK